MVICHLTYQPMKAATISVTMKKCVYENISGKKITEKTVDKSIQKHSAHINWEGIFNITNSIAENIGINIQTDIFETI